MDIDIKNVIEELEYVVKSMEENADAFKHTRASKLIRDMIKLTKKLINLLKKYGERGWREWDVRFTTSSLTTCYLGLILCLARMNLGLILCLARMNNKPIKDLDRWLKMKRVIESAHRVATIAAYINLKNIYDRW
ncbi:hypothetical protein DRN86_03620 [Candidatus Geothermarchaeota archaeon]|nr:MAG: hypothetical protein DRN86_03620 [Candidatus Geothermarchaeota archaeon]